MPWSVARVSPANSHLAEAHLFRQQFTFYNPKITKRVRNQRGYVHRLCQLFPGYLFVQVIDRWRALRSTIGVYDVIMSGDRPATVSDEVVEALRSRETRGAVVLTQFKFGQLVQVKSGPFYLEVGLYEGQRDRDRVAILMNLMGHPTRVILTEDNLVAA